MLKMRSGVRVIFIGSLSSRIGQYLIQSLSFSCENTTCPELGKIRKRLSRSNTQCLGRPLLDHRERIFIRPKLIVCSTFARLIDLPNHL